MKIDFSLVNANPDVDMEKTKKSAAPACGTGTVSGYRLDISGTVMDNAAYGKKGRAAQDIMQDAGRQDVALQRNYMAVMSNSMSTEDFEKLKREGYQPGQIPADQAVTVLDRIKAALAEAGVVIEGYTDDLSAEKLEKITGSRIRANEIVSKLEESDLPVTRENVESVAQALEQATELGPMTEGTVKYMVENNMEPTIENCYKAQFSGAADEERQAHGYYDTGAQGYMAKKAEDYNWESLKDQIESIIEKAGLKADEETMEDAKWLIERGVPLTEESIALLENIKDAALPADREAVLYAVVTALSNGREASQASLAGEEDLRQRAARIKDTVDGLTGEAVEKTVAAGLPVTLENLEKAQAGSGDKAGERRQGKAGQDLPSKQQERASGENGTDRPEETEYRILTARRQLEEVRLQMTVEANLKLLRSGYAIETQEMEALVEQLKSVERDYYQRLFLGDAADIEGKIGLYKEASAKLDGLKGMPASVVGRYISEEELFTVNSIHTNGSAQKEAYDKAGAAYETLMTSPRRDMGDSIQKAFRNVDDILRDMDLEVNGSNQRAVRILGYNSMEINEDNIARVKAADQEIQTLLKRMTPAVTLRMIREGTNPLETDLGTLNDQARQFRQETGEQEEKYSAFLWKLEKNKEITPEERNSYVGIYRLIHQIEKSDGAVIGSVLNQDAQMNLKNLLTAVRNTRSRGMDVKIDESFGTLEETKETGASISEQIGKGYAKETPSETRYYGQVAEELLSTLDPSKLMQMAAGMDTTLEALQDGMREYQAREDIQKEYDKSQARELREAAKAEDTFIRTLLDYHQDVTADTLTAAKNLQSERGEVFRKLFQAADKSDKRDKTRLKEELSEAVLNLQESLEGRDTAGAAYEDLENTAGKIMESAIYGEDAAALDVRAMQLLHKTISLAGNLAREENYEVPVEINGEITSINLKIRHGKEAAGQVTATMDTEAFGPVGAKFYVNDGSVSGYAVSGSESGAKILKDRIGEMAKDLEKAGLRMADFQVTAGDIPDINRFEPDLQGLDAPDGGEGVGTKTLYDLAKAFISAVQK